MSLPAEKYRELLFQILFSSHFLETAKSQDPSFYMKQLKTTRKNVLLAFEEAEKIIAQRDTLDESIAEVSHEYDISRIQVVELNILRLCLYEMQKKEPLDEKIIISEGVRLAKKFSTTASISFINGILDQLYKNNASFAYNA